VAQRLGVLRRTVEEGDRGGADEVGGVAAAAGPVVAWLGEGGPAQDGEDVAVGGDDLDDEVADPRLVDGRGDLDIGDAGDRAPGEVVDRAAHRGDGAVVAVVGDGAAGRRDDLRDLRGGEPARTEYDGSDEERT